MSLRFMIFACILVLQTSTNGIGETVTRVPQDTKIIVATTHYFELHSDPHVDLYHFLIAWASSDAGEWPHYARPVVSERDTWRLLLNEDEQRVWKEALQAYKVAVGRSYVFDAGLIAVRDWTAGLATHEAIPTTDRPLADALEAAFPIFQRHWWPTHDAINRGWIESVAPSLAAIEEVVVPRLEAAYGGRWPEARVSVDAVVYANDVGAYSTGGRLTISSGNGANRMPQALELVFHEASHVDPLEEPLRAGLADAFRACGGTAPDRLWHDMVFFTAGDVTRLALEERGQPGYKHYGEFGVYQRGERWSAELPALERYWRPFLQSKSNDPNARRTTLEAFAGELLKQSTESK